MNIEHLEKLDKGQKKQIGTNIIIFLLIFSFGALIISTGRFETGAHNSDSGQNMRFLEEKFGLSLYDTMSDFSEINSVDLYIKGENLQKQAYYFSIFIAVMFGFCLQYLLNEKGDKR